MVSTETPKELYACPRFNSRHFGKITIFVRDFNISLQVGYKFVRVGESYFNCKLQINYTKLLNWLH